jgi:hypothetical protein
MMTKKITDSELVLMRALAERLVNAAGAGRNASTVLRSKRMADWNRAAELADNLAVATAGTEAHALALRLRNLLHAPMPMEQFDHHGRNEESDRDDPHHDGDTTIC